MIEKINIVVDSDGYTPVRGHKEDAGVDLRTPERVEIKSGGSAIIDTGVHVEIPVGYFGKLESKSGLNVKHGIVSLGGVIDSGYTGSIVAKLYNFGDSDYTFEPGDKVVQLIIQPCEAPELKTVWRLDRTDRGDSGFGSTGK